MYAVLTAVLFGTCAPMTKLLLGEVQPVMLASLLYLGSGFGMVVMILGKRVLHISESSEAPLTRSDIPYLIAIFMTGGVFAPVIMIYSTQFTPAATASLLLNFEPVTTALFAFLFFHEAIGRRIWVAMAIITASCILLAVDPSSGVGISLASIGILIACAFWSLDSNVSRHVSGKDPLMAILVKGFGAGLITFTLAILIGEMVPPLIELPGYLIVGFFSYGGLASVLFLLALRGLGSARAGLFLAISPFFGVFLSFLLFREIPSFLFYIALPIMTLGTWLLITEHHSHIHYHPPLVHNHRHNHEDLHHQHQHTLDMPPLANGEHAHLHAHEPVTHDHPHKPDLHHQHKHQT